MNRTKQSTPALIAEYDARMSARYVRCNLGSARDRARQAHIDAIVDELLDRADNGDAVADEWLRTN